MIKQKLLKNKFVFETVVTVHNLYWKFFMCFWSFLPAKLGGEISNKKFAIGIVTYVDRYERFFKPLIVKLITIFPDTEFIIAVNGYYDKDIQDTYLKDIKVFLSKFRNVKIVDFVEPQSLSKLWNLLILNSSSGKTLILNDDIEISTKFRKNLYNSNIIDNQIALINRSWSHFLISKTIVTKIGWFDQRFPGVGNEDEDYECRLVLNDIEIKDYRIKGLKNIVFITSNFSYGKDILTVNTKYVRQNKIFFDSKWDFSEIELPFYRYVKILNGYIKLKDGMETPVFYNSDLLANKNNIIIK